jgi:hypothetical protein
MRIATVVFALCQALLAGCSEPSEPPTSAAPTAPALDRGRTTPIAGECRTAYELTDFVPNEQAPVSATYHNTGTCQVSHLGTATFVNAGTVDFTGPVHGSGTFTITAANGDRLDGLEETDLGPFHEDGGFGINGTRYVTGGTGRFAGAHATLTVTGSGSGETLTTQQYQSGRLAY